MLAPNPYQAQYAITDLTPGSTPTGAELIEAIQNGQSVSLLISQIVTAGSVAPPIRLPNVNATIPILTSDIEVGINTSASGVTVILPSAATWATSFPGGASGLDLTIIDATGSGATNHITPALNGADTFLEGVTPIITTAFGKLRLRPMKSGSTIVGWYIRGLG